MQVQGLRKGVGFISVYLRSQLCVCPVCVLAGVHLWVEVGKSACVLVGICEVRLSPPARYDPQCPSLLDFLSGCLVRVLWTCRSSTFPCFVRHPLQIFLRPAIEILNPSPMPLRPASLIPLIPRGEMHMPARCAFIAPSCFLSYFQCPSQLSPTTLSEFTVLLLRRPKSQSSS
jgi:hypothetical protein